MKTGLKVPALAARKDGLDGGEEILGANCWWVPPEGQEMRTPSSAKTKLLVISRISSFQVIRLLARRLGGPGEGRI